MQFGGELHPEMESEIPNLERCVFILIICEALGMPLVNGVSVKGLQRMPFVAKSNFKNDPDMANL